MNQEKVETPRYCKCENPQKKYHKECPKCWNCEICGAYGGCDNMSWNWPEELFPYKVNNE